MIADQIKQKIIAALTEMGAHPETVQLQHPENPSFGDYSTNVAFSLTKSLGKAPMAIAEELAQKIKADDVIEKVEVAKPAFVNIWVTQKALTNELSSILSSETYGKKEPNHKKIIMEFGQPNTHKLPHIGHLFSYTYGESMARIFQYEGNDVFRANYQGDIGLHVAKCLWQLQKDNAEGKVPREASLEGRCKYLQVCYQSGATKYEEDETIKNEIDALNKKIYNNDPEIYDLWQETRQWSVDFYKQLEERLGIHYDRWYFETETAALGKQTVLDNVGKVFVEDAGAVIFRGEDYGRHTRVFINKFGNPTYEGKDTGLIQLKNNEVHFDESYTATAVEQKSYWDTVITACELLFPELKGKLNHIDFGMINLVTGKMSSRTGNIIDAIGLIEQVKEEIKTSYPDLENETVERVALASIKYSFLKGEVYKNKVFDLKTSISKEGDSGPYLLYTYVRTKSVLGKEASTSTEFGDMKLSEEEISVLRYLYQLPEIVTVSAGLRSQHLLSAYLFNLAQRFNLFYQTNPILKADDATKNFRLALTKAVSNVLQQGLYLLGIETVEKM